MHLLADGQYIKVSLVFSKKASILLRSRLREFIIVFEQLYSTALSNWRGQLNVFKDAGSFHFKIFIRFFKRAYERDPELLQNFYKLIYTSFFDIHNKKNAEKYFKKIQNLS